MASSKGEHSNGSFSMPTKSHTTRFTSKDAKSEEADRSSPECGKMNNPKKRRRESDNSKMEAELEPAGQEIHGRSEHHLPIVSQDQGGKFALGEGDPSPRAFHSKDEGSKRTRSNYKVSLNPLVHTHADTRSRQLALSAETLPILSWG